MRSAGIESVIVIGDDTARLVGSLGPWPDRWAQERGWTVKNLSLRGTGFTVAAGSGACGLEVCPSFLDVLPAALIEDPAPDLIVVAGGIWDGVLPRSEMREGVAEFFTELRASFPEAQVIALNPLEITQPLPSSVGPIKLAVIQEVKAISGDFVEVGQPYDGQAPQPEVGALIDDVNSLIIERLDEFLSTPIPQ